MNIVKIEHPKTKNAYKSSIEPLTEAYDSKKKYFNDKFKQYYKFNQDIVNIVLCHSLKSLWISIYYGYSIEEDENKPKQINVLDSSTDILNIIGNFVKKELMDEEQIINGKTIKFGTFINTNIVVPLNTKEDIKDFIFFYINLYFQQIKKICKKRKVRLINDDIWECFFILFKRCKILLDINKEYYKKNVYNMDDDEEKDIFEEYLKLNSPQKFEY